MMVGHDIRGLVQHCTAQRMFGSEKMCAWSNYTSVVVVVGEVRELDNFCIKSVFYDWQMLQ